MEMDRNPISQSESKSGSNSGSTSEMTSQIEFKPIHEGLGFHRLDPGQSYHPDRPKEKPVERKTYTQTGAGAIAAGQPTFRFPEVPQIPTQKPSSPVAKIQIKAFGPGYIFARTLAYLIDTSVNLGFCLLGAYLVVTHFEIESTALQNTSLLLFATSFLMFFNWAVILAQEIAFGTSLGKRLFGLSIEGGIWSILLRGICFIPSVLFCGLGLIWGVLDRNHRCWHDLVSGVQPQTITLL